MVQTVWSETISAGHKKIIFEKPLALRRIFISIKELASVETWCESWISFDDPSFSSYYVLDGQFKHFEVKGDEISQGDIWLRNASGIALHYTLTEILA